MCPLGRQREWSTETSTWGTLLSLTAVHWFLLLLQGGTTRCPCSSPFEEVIVGGGAVCGCWRGCWPSSPVSAAPWRGAAAAAGQRGCCRSSLQCCSGQTRISWPVTDCSSQTRAGNAQSPVFQTHPSRSPACYKQVTERDETLNRR